MIHQKRRNMTKSCPPRKVQHAITAGNDTTPENNALFGPGTLKTASTFLIFQKAMTKATKCLHLPPRRLYRRPQTTASSQSSIRTSNQTRRSPPASRTSRSRFMRQPPMLLPGLSTQVRISRYHQTKRTSPTSNLRKTYLFSLSTTRNQSQA